MRLAHCLVESSVLNSGCNESERKVESLEAHKLGLSFVQDVEVC